MEHEIFHLLVIIFSLAVVVNLIFRCFKLPIILGYLVIGSVAGPAGMNWLHHSEDIEVVAELGLMFLLFRIGLEFSLKKLWELRGSVFVLGGLQVLLSIIGSFIVGYFFSVKPAHSFIVGGVIAMSSTAVVSKMLAEQKEFSTQYGQDMLSILLMQDLMVIPILVFVPWLAYLDGSTSLLQLLGVSLLKAVALIILIYLLGRFVIKHVYRLVSATHSEELFMLLTLFFVLLASWLSLQFKMSLTLGSFLVGMLLSETAYRHKVISEMRPFQDIFLGLFFITIGMQFSFSVMTEYTTWFALMVVGFLLAKGTLIFILSRLSKRDVLTSLITSTRLAHGGEFGFAILVIVKKHQLMPNLYAQVILEGILASLVVAALLNYYITPWLKALFKRQPMKSLQNKSGCDILICGYGPVGSDIAQVLAESHFSFYAIDSRSECVEQAIRRGHPVYYTDASSQEIRHIIEVVEPKAILICLGEAETVQDAVKEILASGYTGEIVARTHSLQQAKELQDLGVKITVPEVPGTVYAMLENTLRVLNSEEELIETILDDYQTKTDLL